MTLAWMYEHACRCDHGIALHRQRTGSCIALYCLCSEYRGRQSST